VTLLPATQIARIFFFCSQQTHDLFVNLLPLLSAELHPKLIQNGRISCFHFITCLLAGYFVSLRLFRISTCSSDL
jgi:hypothetical protein